jgi:hypothetical protein
LLAEGQHFEGGGAATTPKHAQGSKDGKDECEYEFTLLT